MTYDLRLNKTRRAFSIIELSITVAIISIMMASILGASKIIASARLNQARMITFFSPVPKIKGLQLWLETTSTRSFTASSSIDGNVIATWYDINPTVGRASIHNATASGSSQPTYKANGINYLPALKFDGVDDYFTITLSSLYVTQFTIFTAVKINSATSSQGTILGKSSAFEFYNHATSNRSGFKLYDSNELHNYTATYTGSGSGEIPHIFTAVYNSSQSNVMQYYTDGTLRTSTTCLSGVGTCLTSYDISSSYYIGNVDGNPNYSNSYSNYIGEIIVYDRVLTDSEINRVTQYLSKKWKITVS